MSIFFFFKIFFWVRSHWIRSLLPFKRKVNSKIWRPCFPTTFICSKYLKLPAFNFRLRWDFCYCLFLFISTFFEFCKNAAFSLRFITICDSIPTLLLNFSFARTFNTQLNCILTTKKLQGFSLNNYFYF